MLLAADSLGIACCVTHFNVPFNIEQKVQECDARKVKWMSGCPAHHFLTTDTLNFAHHYERCRQKKGF